MITYEYREFGAPRTCGCCDACSADVLNEGTRSNGLQGVQQSEICCAAECETCGGPGCSERPGGQVGYFVVTTHILAVRLDCLARGNVRHQLCSVVCSVLKRSPFASVEANKIKRKCAVTYSREPRLAMDATPPPSQATTI